MLNVVFLLSYIYQFKTIVPTKSSFDNILDDEASSQLNAKQPRHSLNLTSDGNDRSENNGARTPSYNESSSIVEDHGKKYGENLPKTIRDIGPRPVEWKDVPDDAMLNLMYTQLSNKVLNSLFPSVWTPNGAFKATYKHLQEMPSRAVKKDKTIPNKGYLEWCIIFGKVFQCHPAVVTPDWSRIIVRLSRSSHEVPVFGRDGMVRRTITAAKAWNELHVDQKFLIIYHIRTRNSSCADLSSKEGDIQEVLRLLEGANNRPGTSVELLSIGIDRFSTNVERLAWLTNKFLSLDLRLVIVVPEKFPGPEYIFRHNSNGIRYGNFRMSGIAAVVNNEHPENREAAKDLVQILRFINAGKQGTDGNGVAYKKWTENRNGFRICPDAEHVTGIDPLAPVMSRKLQHI
ncbi:hypothetical protein VHEMI10564 [[Torrubiella] hemipterigena]|uniref:Uncharacterized protein n=1 Tax=[Torrubiella] hemipterigena TaxID=1531966 RepID=A0A0A1TDE2_9HYPO|nr:hypothetical protein VHEMI10564 [[Torrubiella] hemipterigena]